MRKLLLATALFAAVSAAGCSKSDSAGGSTAEAKDKKSDEFPSMTIDEVEKAVTDKTATAVDCNQDRTRKKLGVVPGSIIPTSVDNFDAKEMPADKGAKLVFYCADPG